jgi:hypothetical protein
MTRKKIRATPPCKDWELPPGGWRTPNADKAAAAQKKIADRIDGYDRDDLGESPDF